MALTVSCFVAARLRAGNTTSIEAVRTLRIELNTLLTLNLRVVEDERRPTRRLDLHILELNSFGIRNRQPFLSRDLDIFENDVGDEALRQSDNETGSCGRRGGDVGDADVAEDGC